MLQQIQQIRDELNAQFLEREEVVDGILTAILSKNHVFFVGAPGTAKSQIVNEVCSRITEANYFQWLLTKFSTPEEIFGTVSLKALENDEYRRVTTSKLPEAVIAFLDEIFKANSAILNSLLTAVNERKFHNNGHPTDIPLQSLFGASNELPEGESLSALYDRFMLKYQVDYIIEDDSFRRLLIATVKSSPTEITLADLEKAQTEVETIPVSDAIIAKIVELRRNLKAEGIIVSDRKWRQSLSVLKAYAYLNGHSEVTEDDFEILIHVLWNRPEQRRTVTKVVNTIANPVNQKAIEFLDIATEIYNNAINADKDKKTEAGVEANMKLKNVLKSVQEEIKNLPTNKAKKLKEVAEKVNEMNKTVVNQCLGID